MYRELKKNKENKDFIQIYGIHAVQAALKNKHRKHQKLIISVKNKEFLTKKIKQNINEIVIIPNKDFNKIYGNKITHQGIILKTTNLIQPSLEEILIKSSKKNKEVVIMLDHVTDPQNIGSIMRSCSLFNCHSIVVAKDKAPDITPAMTKTASGALEVVNYVKVTNLAQAIIKFKKNNFWTLGFDINSNTLKNNFVLPKKCLLVFGAEGKGLRDLTKKKCDQILAIPINQNYEFKIESLNVSNACTIMLYEYFKNNNLIN